MMPPSPVRGPGSLYGYDVETDFALARLVARPGIRGTLELREAQAPLAPSQGTLVHSWSGPDCTFTLTRNDGRLLATCSVTGNFVIDGASGIIQAAPDPSRGPDAMWEHRIVGTAFPVLLAEQGDLVTHAAAIEVEGGAVAFAGPTGRGKSTVALAAWTRLGYRIVAEDGVVVELAGPEPVVWPGAVGVRIRPDVLGAVAPEAGEPREHGRRKATTFLPPGAHVEQPTPLRAVVILGERGDELTLMRLEPAAAVPALMPTLIYGGSDRLAQAFAGAARLVELVPVFRCSVPNDLDGLAEALERLVDGLALGRADAATEALAR